MAQVATTAAIANTLLRIGASMGFGGLHVTIPVPACKCFRVGKCEPTVKNPTAFPQAAVACLKSAVANEHHGLTFKTATSIQAGLWEDSPQPMSLQDISALLGAQASVIDSGVAHNLVICDNSGFPLTEGDKRVLASEVIGTLLTGTVPDAADAKTWIGFARALGVSCQLNAAAILSDVAAGVTNQSIDRYLLQDAALPVPATSVSGRATKTLARSLSAAAKNNGAKEADEAPANDAMIASCGTALPTGFVHVAVPMRDAYLFHAQAPLGMLVASGQLAAMARLVV